MAILVERSAIDLEGNCIMPGIGLRIVSFFVRVLTINMQAEV